MDKENQGKFVRLFCSSFNHSKLDICKLYVCYTERM